MFGFLVYYEGQLLQSTCTRQPAVKVICKRGKLCYVCFLCLYADKYLICVFYLKITCATDLL